jgi:dTDP-4-dehydrorhamnose 3,5-epimerase
MKFRPLALAGAALVELQRHEDERGWFARLHCEREQQAAGIPGRFVQSNLSFNRRAGTLRGLHFQWPPSREGKLVRCIRGGIYDAIVDLRPDSETFTRHFGVELRVDSPCSLYVPPGFAHGFQTLADDTEVLYLMGDYYEPELSTGLRYDEPAFGIRWPMPAGSMSPRDAAAPAFDRARYTAEYTSRAAAGRAGRP